MTDKWRWELFQLYRNSPQFHLSATAFYRQSIVEIYIPLDQLAVAGWLLDVVVAWWLSKSDEVCTYYFVSNKTHTALHRNPTLRCSLQWHHKGVMASPICLNPLRAKFLRENINIYLHFMSFLHTNKTQVAEIPPRVRQGPAYSTWSISWLLMSWRGKEPGHQQPWYWPS